MSHTDSIEAPDQAAPAAGSAAASGPGAASGTTDAASPFDTHLRAGRAAEQANDWATAVTELDAAVAAKPGDAAALSELTWAAVHAGQLDHARDVGVRAVEAAKDPKLEAMALYNLGLAEEPIDRHAALSLYKASIDVRFNKTVMKSLHSAHAKLNRDRAANKASPHDRTDAGDALLDKLHVTPFFQNDTMLPPEPERTIIAVLEASGADYDSRMSSGDLDIAVSCQLASGGDSCQYDGSDPKSDDRYQSWHVEGEQARTLIAGLEAKGIQPKGTSLRALIECHQDFDYNGYATYEYDGDGVIAAATCTFTQR